MQNHSHPTQGIHSHAAAVLICSVTAWSRVAFHRFLVDKPFFFQAPVPCISPQKPGVLVSLFPHQCQFKPFCISLCLALLGSLSFFCLQPNYLYSGLILLDASLSTSSSTDRASVETSPGKITFTENTHRGPGGISEDGRVGSLDDGIRRLILASGCSVEQKMAQVVDVLPRTFQPLCPGITSRCTDVGKQTQSCGKLQLTSSQIKIKPAALYLIPNPPKLCKEFLLKVQRRQLWPFSPFRQLFPCKFFAKSSFFPYL